MYLYNNGERSVCAWNAIDVKMHGFLQHGHVIGLEHGGDREGRLIVDFGCPEQRSVLVDCGQAFGCFTHPGYSSTVRPLQGAVVEVLLFDRPDHPWKWYPGRILIDCFAHMRDYARVEVIMPEQRWVEIVPDKQIRLPLAENKRSRRRLASSDFQIRTCILPHGYWILQPCLVAKLIRAMEDRFSLRFTRVFSQEMHYIRRRAHGLIKDITITRFFEKKKREFVLSSHDFSEDSNRLDEVTSEPERNKRASEDDGDLAALPVELMKEVFLSLDTIDRQRCRRSCRGWERILTLTEMCRDVRVNVLRPHPAVSSRPEGEWHRYLALYSCIFKYITPATQSICIGDTEVRCGDIDTFRKSNQALTLIKGVLNEAGSRVHRLVVQHRSLMVIPCGYELLELPMVFAEMAAHYAGLANCCDRLIWTDYSLKYGDVGKATAEFAIPLAVFVLVNVDETLMWNVFEEHVLGSGMPLNVERIAHCIGGCAGKRDKAWMVKKILKNCQTGDPRPSAHYRGIRWTEDNVASVNVRQLNTLCQRALWRYVQKWDARGKTSDKL
ncbi:uncharacterized protein LOC129592435 [Paramacrobiotus metropolitanus]|uniref:uncharacterized protein LOC129592435 n=1 Tax=Paramacrobiotus metropolitanus TaxID=2943436 RepID=UPI002445B434|nr:uncharacterized protein LOC129592435 [Paramacrobiotus metropolitanus]